MSAIWGIVSLNNEKVNIDEYKILKEAYKDCKIDRYEDYLSDYVCMGTGIQYFTKEAHFEKGPVKLDETLYINQDIMLDNRDELAGMLGLGDISKLADGDIFASFYEKKCAGRAIKELGKALDAPLGAYAVASFDLSKNEVTLISDAVGNRYVYYMEYNGFVYYSSLLKPLKDINKKAGLNEEFISDFLCLDNLIMFLNPIITPYNGIFRLAPGTALTIGKKTKKSVRYFDPNKVKKDKHIKSDAEYKAEFLDTFSKCVTSVLRSDEETAILLSGGYDSNAVAYFANKELESQGKRLYSFTSVPIKGFDSKAYDKENYGVISDETELVKKTCDIWTNIEPTFMTLDDMNAWEDHKWYMKIAEMPYKSVGNSIWLYRASELAREKGARIILSGAAGNSTISFDNTFEYLAWMLRHIKIRKFLHEVKCLSRRYGTSRKKIVKYVVPIALFGHMRINKISDSYANCKSKYFYLRNHIYKGRFIQWIFTYRTFENLFFSLSFLRQSAELDLKNSLFTGVINRDPTKDKRIIAFTKKIPKDQFLKYGVRRRLICEYMKDIIPNHILNNPWGGRQSADLKYRLEKRKDIFWSEMADILNINKKNYYVDVYNVINDLKKKDWNDYNEFEIVRLIYTSMVFEFFCEV